MNVTRALVLLSSVSAFTPAAVLADPVLIRSGYLTTSGSASFAEFVLVASDGTRMEGRWPGAAVPCTGCTAGTAVSPDARFSYDQVPFVFGDPFATGRVTVDGTESWLYFSGELLFDGASFTLPALSAGPAQNYRFNRSFAFTGEVTGYDRLLEGPFEIEPVFSGILTSFGTASLGFRGELVNGVSRYSYLDTRYDFTDPVPEPGTVLLTISGLGAVALRRRRRVSRAGS